MCEITQELKDRQKKELSDDFYRRTAGLVKEVKEAVKVKGESACEGFQRLLCDSKYREIDHWISFTDNEELLHYAESNPLAMKRRPLWKV